MDPEEEAAVRELGAGLVAGATAWVLGYVVTYLLRSGSIEDDLRAAVLSPPDDREVTADAVGWVFFNAHHVSTEHSRHMAGSFDVNIIVENGGTLYLLYAIPPLLLLAAGAIAVRYAGAIETDLDCVRVGAMAVAGYLPLSVLGMTLFTVQFGLELIRPNPVTTVLLAGLVYPLVLGAAGGLLVRRIAPG